MTIVRPKTTTLQAWQFGSSTPPVWVMDALKGIGDDIFVVRRSGKQLLVLGEWLLKHPDERDLIWCTDAEFKRDYEVTT